MVGGAQAISETGVIVGSVTTGINEFTAVVFDGGAQTLLQTPTGTNSGANDVSPNGEYVGGFVSFEDLTLFETIDHAVVWVNGQLTELQDYNGDAFEGKVISVSDNGYAVGQSSDGLGFIWHESFAGVRMFDEWLLTEHGETLPTTVTSVVDVLFAGNKLHFAVNGSAYLVSVEVADTSPFPYHNKGSGMDVNGDGQVVPLDVLIVINAINANGAHKLPASRPIGHPYLDVNKDGFVTPIDALLIINQLNRSALTFGADIELLGAAESESELVTSVTDIFFTGSQLIFPVLDRFDAMPKARVSPALSASA